MARDRQRPDDERPTAEEMLERIRRAAGAGVRGRLRIYLGMAPGVGKTYAMLMEGRRRKERGTDVVVGFVETYNRPKTIEAIGDLEVIPRKKIPYKGVVLEEIDAEAIIRRHPDIALVDELAHSNAPGSKHEKRWQDVEELLNHGITVISTLNIQHLESLADIVETITGVRVRERIPDWVVDQADEIELVDMSPNALRQRLRHGNVYPEERVESALHQFFREGNLGALRELALRKVATAVEMNLEEYMREHKIESRWPAAERVMVAVDERPSAQQIIRRAWRIASRLQADLIAVFVETPRWAKASASARRQLDENLQFAADLGATVVSTTGEDVVKELARLSREENVGTIVIGRSHHGRLYEFMRGSIAAKLLHLVPDADLLVVAGREPEH